MDIKTQIKLRRKILRCITKHESGCWIWNKRSRSKGYAQISFQLDGRTRYTSPHRLAYILFRNRMDLMTDKKMFVCHKCDNKDCVNPNHMFVGDWLENAMDDVLRNPKVSKGFMIKITELYRKKHGIHKSVIIRRLVNAPHQTTPQLTSIPTGQIIPGVCKKSPTKPHNASLPLAQ